MNTKNIQYTLLYMRFVTRFAIYIRR
ncbi:truncated Rh158.1 [macacine betaherpesvirus 3]|nr:truncated Rh158.1 [macacine betaherpesvirus 3]